MKKFFKDFKAFITKGNIMDLAVAVVVGGAFGKIVTSLVNDIIMPLITLLVGGTSVKEWKWVITPATIVDGVNKAENALHYGNFLQAIIDFLIIALFIFLALRILMNAKKKLGQLGEEFTGADAKVLHAFKKECKAKGMTGKVLKDAMIAKEAELEADQKAKAAQIEADKAAADAKAAAEKPEVILKDIRDLLAAQADKDKK